MRSLPPASSLIWPGTFLQKNFDALFAKQGPQFRDYFVANFMTNFSDERPCRRTRELSRRLRRPQAAAMMAGRAQEVIAISADLKARALPAIDAWIKARK